MRRWAVRSSPLAVIGVWEFLTMLHECGKIGFANEGDLIVMLNGARSVVAALHAAPTTRITTRILHRSELLKNDRRVSGIRASNDTIWRPKMRLQSMPGGARGPGEAVRFRRTTLATVGLAVTFADPASPHPEGRQHSPQVCANVPNWSNVVCRILGSAKACPPRSYPWRQLRLPPFWRLRDNTE